MYKRKNDIWFLLGLFYFILIKYIQGKLKFVAIAQYWTKLVVENLQLFTHILSKKTLVLKTKIRKI